MLIQLEPLITRIMSVRTTAIFFMVASSLTIGQTSATDDRANKSEHPADDVTAVYDIHASAMRLPAKISLGVADGSSDELEKPSKLWPSGFQWLATSVSSRYRHEYRIHGATAGTRVTITYALMGDILPTDLIGEGQGDAKIQKQGSSQFRTENIRIGFNGFVTWRISAILLGGDGIIAISVNPNAAQHGNIFVDTIKINLDSDHAAKGGIAALPLQTPVSDYRINEDGIPTGVRESDGARVFNIANIAHQAQIGRNPTFKLSSQKASHPTITTPVAGIDDPYRVVALDWLESHAHKLTNGATLWSYDFDNAYNDVKMRAPWNSAFGQAYVMEAFVTAFRDSHLPKYKDLAIAAAKAFDVPISDGGLYSLLDGDKFFEEVAVEPGRHILNAHMVSTLALLRAGRELNDPEIAKIGEEGVATLKRHLWKYDLGYWSRYDLAPKSKQFVIRFLPYDAPSADAFKIDKVSVVQPNTGKSVILDVGADNDAEGALHISGSDWKEAVDQDGLTVRSMVFGPDIRETPAVGGSIQNSYVWLDLPDEKIGPFNGDESWLLKIDYFDAGRSRVALQYQAADQGNFMEFKTLENGEISSTGSKQWRTAYIPITSKNLAWFVGPPYQTFHIDLLQQLADLTGDALFEVYCNRWTDYLEAYTNIDAEIANRQPVKASAPNVH